MQTSDIKWMMVMVIVKMINVNQPIELHKIYVGVIKYLNPHSTKPFFVTQFTGGVVTTPCELKNETP